MLRKNLSLILCILLMGSTLIAQGFEGVIKAEYYNAQNDSRSTVKWYIAEGKVALQMIMQSDRGKYVSTFIAQKSSQNLDILSKTPDGKKLHHSIPTSEVSKPDQFPSVSDFEVMQKDETQTIQGYQCTKIAGESSSSKTIAWIAKGIDFPFYQYADYFKSDYNLALLSRLQINGFPLQSVTTDNRGMITEKVEVEEIQKKNLDPSVFQVPSDYKTVEKSQIGVMGR